LHQEAEHFLSQLDADWAWLIQTVGQCNFEPKHQQAPFEALVRAIAFQQLHAKAGEAIIGRLCAVYENKLPSPQLLLATDKEILRTCGFSYRKIETLHGIAQGAINGLVPSFSNAQKMTDEALIKQMTQLKGVGRWTVEMLLMFNLGRPDILPVTDFGIVEGYKRLKKLENAPKPKEMQKIGEAWQPFRTVASWYLWRVPK
jgi:DNA-3-methyladenine glycosylase II